MFYPFWYNHGHSIVEGHAKRCSDFSTTCNTVLKASPMLKEHEQKLHLEMATLRLQTNDYTLLLNVVDKHFCCIHSKFWQLHVHGPRRSDLKQSKSLAMDTIDKVFIVVFNVQKVHRLIWTYFLFNSVVKKMLDDHHFYISHTQSTWQLSVVQWNQFSWQLSSVDCYSLMIQSNNGVSEIRK